MVIYKIHMLCSRTDHNGKSFYCPSVMSGRPETTA